MSIERVVTLLTPVFAALAGLVTTFVSQAVPGVNLNSSDLTALFVAGALAAAGAAAHWIHGRQKLEATLSNADKLADHVVAKINASPVAGPALSEIEGALKAHTDQIVKAIGSAVHAPVSVEQVADEILHRAEQAKPPVPAPVVPPPAA